MKTQTRLETVGNRFFRISQCHMENDHWRVRWLDDNHTECFDKKNYNSIDDLRHVLLDRCGVPMSQQ